MMMVMVMVRLDHYGGGYGGYGGGLPDFKFSVSITTITTQCIRPVLFYYY